MKERKFEHGRIVVTRAVDDKIQNDKKFHNFVAQSFGRHPSDY